MELKHIGQAGTFYLVLTTLDATGDFHAEVNIRSNIHGHGDGVAQEPISKTLAIKRAMKMAFGDLVLEHPADCLHTSSLQNDIAKALEKWAADY